MKKKKEKFGMQWVFIAAMAFFVLWGFEAVLRSDFEFIFDRFWAALQVCVVWLLWRRYKFPTPTLIVTGIAILLHHLKLYGQTYFGIGFDNYMHFVGAFAITLLAYAMLNDCSSCRKDLFKQTLFAFAIAVGIASLIEPMEFLGYAKLGEGEGLLFYGYGDGGWMDTAGDLFANMVGAATAAIFLTFQGLRHRKD